MRRSGKSGRVNTTNSAPQSIPEAHDGVGVPGHAGHVIRPVHLPPALMLTGPLKGQKLQRWSNPGKPEESCFQTTADQISLARLGQTPRFPALPVWLQVKRGEEVKSGERVPQAGGLVHEGWLNSSDFWWRSNEEAAAGFLSWFHSLASYLHHIWGEKWIQLVGLFCPHHLPPWPWRPSRTQVQQINKLSFRSITELRSAETDIMQSLYLF